MHMSDLRPGEVPVALPAGFDASLYFIGIIRTPWATRAQCPRQGDPVNGPLCQIEIGPTWREGLARIEEHNRLQVLYWMHQARRDLLCQSPRSDGRTAGTFALRSPVRPNPIASSVVTLVETRPAILVVRGLDCLDGTPVVDIKPERCSHAP